MILHIACVTVTLKFNAERLDSQFIQETTSIVLVEYTCETPRLIFERLNVLDLDEKCVARLSTLYIKWARKIVDLGQIDVLHVVGRVVVANLTSGPVDAFDLDDLSILDLTSEWNIRMPSILRLLAASIYH